MELKEDSVLHLSLGDLKYFSNSKLLQQSDRYDQDKFVLSLALAHSDLKAFLFFWDCLGEIKSKSPSKGNVSAKFGYHSGLKWFVYRYLVGVLSETLVLVEKNKSILEGKELSRAIEKLDEKFRKTWVELITLARDIVPEKDLELKKLRNKISSIRNAITFHYSHGTMLADGFNSAFGENKGRDDGRAYFTSGESLEKTSFLFVDAAVETILLDVFKTKGMAPGEDAVADFVRAAHVSIAMIIQQYLRQVQADITTLGPSDREYPVGSPKR